MEQKLYTNMTPDEQLRYVTDLTTFIDQKLPVLERIGDAWEKSKRKDMETGLRLLAAFQFARDFVDKAIRYGDYAARVRRIRVYIDKIKKEISGGLTLRGSDGHTYALVAPTVPQRRRGRPTAEEAKARRNGLAVPRPTDVAMQKQITIARLLGIDVIVSQDAPREKNNAELAADRAARAAEEAKRNPSLFATPDNSSQNNDITESRNNDSTAPAPSSAPSGSPAGTTPCAQLLNDTYEMRMTQDKLHLDQLAWLLSPALADQTKNVQALRVTAESASERAKTLAELGQPADAIEPYARQAKEATEAYLAIYAAVDDELAILHKRLLLDAPYTERFKKRFKGVDIEKVLHISRPYYEKMKSPELDLRIRTLIEQDNPEYAEQMKAEEKKKRELQSLHRYIMRTDKPASDERVKTMTKRIDRVRELAGDEAANVYLPVLEKTKEDNKEWRNAKAAATAVSGSAADKKKK